MSASWTSTSKVVAVMPWPPVWLTSKSRRAVAKLRDTYGLIGVLVNDAAVMPSGRLRETSPHQL